MSMIYQSTLVILVSALDQAVRRFRETGDGKRWWTTEKEDLWKQRLQETREPSWQQAPWHTETWIFRWDKLPTHAYAYHWTLCRFVSGGQAAKLCAGFCRWMPRPKQQPCPIIGNVFFLLIPFFTKGFYPKVAPSLRNVVLYMFGPVWVCNIIEDIKMRCLWLMFRSCDSLFCNDLHSFTMPTNMSQCPKPLL